MTTKLNTNQLGSDQTVWNASNLVAGTNIILTPKVDRDTVLLLHFNDDLTDSSSYALTAEGHSDVYPGSSSATLSAGYTDGHFNKALAYTAPGNNVAAWYPYTQQAKIATNKEFTIDFWTKKQNGDIHLPAITIEYSWGGSITDSGIRFSNIPFTEMGSSYTSYISLDDIETGEWFHVAFVWKNYEVTIYINGTNKYTYSVSDYKWNRKFAVDALLDFFAFIFGDGYLPIDELRLSCVARWTGNFTVPTAPYSVTDENVKQINNTLDISYKQDIISDLATIRSGATAGSTAVQPAALAAYATIASVANCPKASIMTGYTGNEGSTLTSTASGTITRVYKNGALLTADTDYTVSGSVITFTTALVTTDRVSVETEGGITKIIRIAQPDYTAIETASALDANAFYLVIADPVTAE